MSGSTFPLVLYANLLATTVFLGIGVDSLPMSGVVLVIYI